MALTRRLNRLMLGTWLEGEAARQPLGAGTQRPHRARGAVRRREVNVDHGPPTGRLSFIPAQARSSLGTGYSLSIPINLEVRDIEPGFLPGLPLTILSDWTNELDRVVAGTRYQAATMHVASIDELLCREQPNPIEFCLNRRQLPEIRGRGDRRFDLGQQVRVLVVTGFGQMHLVTSPGRPALAGIARFGLVR